MMGVRGCWGVHGRGGGVMQGVGGMHSCGREFIMFVATSVIWATTRFFDVFCNF